MLHFYTHGIRAWGRDVFGVLFIVRYAGLSVHCQVVYNSHAFAACRNDRIRPETASVGIL